MGSLQSALLGYGLFKFITSWGWSTPLGTRELVLLQTTSVAAATMPLAAGFVGILPAFAVLPADEGGPIFLPVWKQLLWCFALAPLGVFVAIPLREAFIVRAKLRFPSGTATAEMITVLQESDKQSRLQHRSSMADATSLLPDHPAAPRAAALQLVDRAGAGAPAEEGEDTALLGGASSPEDDGPALSHDSPGAASMQSKWRVLVGTMALSALLGLLMHYLPLLKGLPLLSWVGAPSATAYGWTLSPSMAYVGQGLIMGPHTVLSMLLGAVAGWGVLGPLASQQGWAPGAVMDSTSGARGWITWLSLALMLGDTITALAVLLWDMACPASRAALCPCAVKRTTAQGALAQQSATATTASPSKGSYGMVGDAPPVPATAPPAVPRPSLCSQLLGLPAALRKEAAEVQWTRFSAEDRVPRVVWLPGLLLSAALLVAVVSPVMRVPAGEVLVAVLLAMFVAPLAIRALGVSDLNPTSGLGKLSQGVFAGVAPGSVVSNLMAGAVAEAAAQQAGDLSQDLKTGYLLQASSMAQFYAQMWGSLASVFFTVGAYALYTSAYSVPGPELQAPTAAVWLDMAQLISGKAELPAHVGEAAGLAGAFAVAAAAVSASLPPALRWLVPSGTAAGVGMYLTPNWTIPRVIGGVGQWVWKRYWPQGHDDYMIVVASGFVLGEGVMSILTATLTASGVGDAWSCAGCEQGMCGGGC